MRLGEARAERAKSCGLPQGLVCVAAHPAMTKRGYNNIAAGGTIAAAAERRERKSE
ncbi:hypothetical protein [Bosea sp. (in: a-proteobacteria)]|uniref:hypothetical protein n=1 Tax=Bosea sp. (in: a-proteobacteria) TaxID=1871050 RepID=UPI002FC9E8B0